MNGKGLGAFPASCTTAGVADLGWNLLAEDVSLPAAVLYEARVRHNLQWMQRFMEAYRVKLAPHGKTTMSPALFQRQIDGGAWGITLANAPQVQAAHNHGIRRVLMANQLVGRANMAIIARILRQDPDFTYFCIIDSPANAAHLGAYFGEQGLTLPVLIELGPAGGRRRARRRAIPGGGRRDRPLARAGPGRHRSLRGRAAGRTGHPRLPAPRHRRCAAWPKRAACARTARH